MKGYCDFCDDITLADDVPYAICDNKECMETETCIVSAYYHALQHTGDPQKLEQSSI